MQKKRYYRNIISIGDIEPQALWKKQNKLIVLVDSDRYASVEATESNLKFFTEVDIPKIAEKHL